MIDHLSASQINTYLGCSLKYKYSYIDEIPKPFKPAALALGSALHSALEWLHKKWQNGEEPNMEEVWNIFEADWYAQSKKEILFKNYDTAEDVLNEGKNLLGVYYQDATEIKRIEVHCAAWVNGSHIKRWYHYYGIGGGPYGLTASFDVYKSNDNSSWTLIDNYYEPPIISASPTCQIPVSTFVALPHGLPALLMIKPTPIPTIDPIGAIAPPIAWTIPLFSVSATKGI